MNKPTKKVIARERLIILCAVFFTFSLWASIAGAEATKIQPLNEADVKSVISRLNGQGIVFCVDKNVKKDEVFGYDKDGSFGMADTGMGWYLYKVDINNDKEDEYLLMTVGGSGGYLNIEAIYKDINGKLSDIYEEIKVPMIKCIERENDIFMNGSIDIENIDGEICFILKQVTRDYSIDDYERSFRPPEWWKFIWDNSGLKLMAFQVNPPSGQ